MAQISNINATFNSATNELNVAFDADLINVFSIQVDYNLGGANPQTAFGSVVSSTPTSTSMLVPCPGPSFPCQYTCTVGGQEPATGNSIFATSPPQTFNPSGNNRIDPGDSLRLAPSAATAKVGDTVRLEVAYLDVNGNPDRGIPIFFGLGPSVALGQFSQTRAVTDAAGKCAVDFRVTGRRFAGVNQGPVSFLAQAGSSPVFPFFGALGLFLGNRPPFDVAVIRLVP